MFLSRLQLDLRRRSAQRLIGNPYAVHAAVMRGFPGLPLPQPDLTPETRREVEQARRKARILFRVEPLPAGRPEACILVQSRIRPDWSALARDFDGGLQYDTKELTLAFSNGDRLRFRLRANPTFACRPRNPADDDGRRGQGLPLGSKTPPPCKQRSENGEKRRSARLAVFGEERQFAWLERVGRRCGFAVTPTEVLVQDEGWTRLWKQKHPSPIRFVTVLFEGRLTVTDADAFSEAISQGVGAAKGFGCGLLSLAPTAGSPRLRG